MNFQRKTTFILTLLKLSVQGLHNYFTGLLQRAIFVFTTQLTGMVAFVLNDGNKKNSYGFRVRNSGIEMGRFYSNPVMLDEHWASNRYVLGRWKDVQKEGDLLTALPEFDTADENADKIRGKVERGFIKGASIGILFDPMDMQLQPDGVYELVKCELMEASICAIPSNANAVRLYDKNTRELMSDQQIGLSLKKLNNYQLPETKIENTDMKKIILSMAALTALGLLDHNTNEGVDVTLVEREVGKLKADNEKLKGDVTAKETALTAANAALQALKDAETAKLKAEAETEVQKAIDEGRIDAPKKEDWVNLMLSNPELAKATLSAIPAKQTLSNQVANPAPGAASDMTAEKFEKMTEEAQLAWKEANTEAYQKLFA